MLVGFLLCQRCPALLPGLCQLADQGFDLLDLANVDADQRHSGRGKQGIDKHVALLTVFSFMRIVVQFNAEHGHPILVTADQEVDMLLAYFVEGSDLA